VAPFSEFQGDKVCVLVLRINNKVSGNDQMYVWKPSDLT
jgi:hypothetical protein